MAVEKLKVPGLSKAKVVCDICGASVSVACGYHVKGNGNKHPNEGQARARAANQGWSFVKNKIHCPACEKKRKSDVNTQAKPAPDKNAPPEPTKRQRIDIITMLAEVYDIEAGRYMNGDTDDTVAEVLGAGVMPGWVAQIREAEFGPDGGNENIEQLEQRVDQFEKDATAILRAAEQVTTSAQKKLAEVSAMKVELDRIKQAIGPRARAKAKV